MAHTHRGVLSSAVPIVFVLLFFGLLFFSLEIFAQTTATISAEKFFQRCYSQLTGLAVPNSHDLLPAVRSGALTPENACLQVLNRALLGSNGLLTNLNNSSSQIQMDAKLILQNFNDFHRTWFERDNEIEVVNDSPSCVVNRDVNDYSESALHLSRALLASNVTYSSIVTGSFMMEAQRSLGVPDPNIATFSLFPIAEFLHFNTAPIFLQKGELTGIKPIDGSHLRYGINVQIAPFTGDSVNINRTYGGGILGSQNFLLLNFGQPSYQRMNGGLYMPRRWSRSVYHDLLCRDLPVVRASDVSDLNLVQPNSTLPFRTGLGCMQCHGSMDGTGLGGVARNLIVSYTAPYCSTTAPGEVRRTVFMHKYAVTQSAETVQPDNDTNYYLRPSNGKLFFRSYDGALVNQPVASFDELGQAMANTNDLYVCAAKRYFQHFTGMDIPLYDVGDPNWPSSPEITWYRNKIIDLGVRLRTHQSLRQLIQEIIQLPLYRQADLKDFGE